MNTNTNMLRSKIVGATALCALGAFALLPVNTADARLVFSTEFESSTEDLDGDGNYTLSFGSNLAGEIYYDESADSFVINKSTTIQGDATVTGNSATTGNSTVGGTLAVTGNSTLSNTAVNGTLSTTGNTTVGGTLNTTGAATLGNNLTVVGTSNLQGATDVDSTLNVDGATTLNSGLTVTAGNTALQNTAVTGTLSTTGNATVGGTLNATGAATLGNNLSVAGTTTLQGATTANSDITLNNDSQIINLRAENKAYASAPACADATDLGRIFYDTTNNTLLYCYQNGGTFGWSSTSGDAVNATATYYAEFANFSVLADGTNNIGTMVAEYDDTDNRSFYKWSTRKNTANDYDVVLQWQVPSDFQSFQANSLQVDHKQSGTAAALAITVEDNANTSIATAAPANSATWATQNIDLTAATVNPGDTITAKFKMTAQSANDSFLSNVKVNYVKK